MWPIDVQSLIVEDAVYDLMPVPLTSIAMVTEQTIKVRTTHAGLQFHLTYEIGGRRKVGQQTPHSGLESNERRRPSRPEGMALFRKHTRSRLEEAHTFVGVPRDSSFPK